MARVSLRNADVRFEAGCAVPGRFNRCWVTSLTTLLGPVAREEIRREMTGAVSVAAQALSYVVEAGLRLAQADQVVFPAHHLLTTSLYDDPPTKAAPRPGHATVIRSLTRRDHAAVLASRGTFWPVRVVWIIDDIARDWRPRRDARRDLQLLERLKLDRRRYSAAMPGDSLARVLDLYRRLYIDRYSRHNPDYTADYLQTCLDHGILEILTLERDGEILAFCALHARGDALSVPLVGYEDRIEGLYRAVMALPALEAEARGLTLNLSAGASHFKRHRGALPHVEYLMIRDEHLPAWRRFAYRVTGALLQALEPQLIKAATR